MKKILLFIAILMGLSSVPLLAQEANMSKYVTLTVVPNKAIKLNFKAAQSGTPVRIVSGLITRDITVGTDWYNTASISTFTVNTVGTTMKVYGDIVGFRCNNNGDNITAIDPSNNTDLRELNCALNSITELDVSSNPQLNTLIVYGNKFTTLGLDKLYCSLPSRTTSTFGVCYPMNKANDNNKSKVAAANGSNTISKSWEIRYWNDNTNPQNNIPSTGIYVCGSPEPDLTKHITLNVIASRVIDLKFKAKNPNTTLRIETGDNVQEITVGNNWSPEVYKIPSMGSTIKIYGDLIGLDCSDNGNTVTAVESANNTQLEELMCSSNNISELDVTANTKLKKLYCLNNKLKTLNLTPLTELEVLDCNFNEITEIDLRNKPQLKDVNISANKVSVLAFNESTLLRSLICNNNEISSLDFTNQSKLEELYCQSNKLTTLDISNKPLLTTVNCSNNLLTSLNINNDPKLVTLMIYSNAFTTLEFDKIFCSLPVVDGVPGRVYPINYQQVNNAPLVTPFLLYANRRNAIDKNWEVKNWNNGNTNNAHNVVAIGTYKCGSPEVDLTKFITLKVKNSDLENGNPVIFDFNFESDVENTTVRIESGTNVQEVIIGNEFATTPFNTISLAETVKIYGDISRFKCSNNLENILGLDASKHNTVKEIICNDNEIDTIKLGNNNNLFVLHCENNKITELNLEGNTRLNKLYCSNNELDTLILDNNTELAFVDCSNNIIDNLAITKNLALTHLECSNNKLPKLDLSNNKNLTRLFCYNNLFNTEETNKIYCALPNVIGTSGLCYILNTVVDANNQDVVEATSDNARYKNWEVKYYNNNQAPQNNVPSAGTYDCGTPIPTPDPDGGYMVLTVKQGEDIKINLRAIAEETPVRIKSGNTVRDIVVGTNWISDANPSDYTVTAEANTIKIIGKIDGLNFSQNGNNIIKFDGGNNTHLKDLYCSENTAMTELNLIDNTQLRELDCNNCNLPSIDLTKNYELKNINCSYNKITNIDLSNNTELSKLICNANKLTKLNLKQNNKLFYLLCSHNQIAELDLRENPKLTYVNCNDNENIDKLFLTNNPILEELYCKNNKLIGIDLSMNTELKELDCSKNSLLELNVSNNKKLEILSCDNNLLTELNLSNNIQLHTVNFYANKFSTDALNEIYCSMPDRKNTEKGNCYPLFAKTDVRHDILAAATSNNARNKNWEVRYKHDGLPIQNNGNYDCNAVVDSTRLITLVVTKGVDITFNLRAQQGNTRAHIINGDKVQSTMVETDWKTNNYVINSINDTIKIYGNISGLNCNDNKSNLKGINITKNPEIRLLYCVNNNISVLDLSKQKNLTELYCNNNKITTLDVSNKPLLKTVKCYENSLSRLYANYNASLEFLDCSDNKLTHLDLSQNINLNELYCYHNFFNTEAINQIYCSLSSRDELNNSICYPLNDTTDANHAAVIAATSANARNKNWKVKYLDNKDIIDDNNQDVPSNGKYDCKLIPADLSKWVVLNVKKGENITVDFLAENNNATVQVENGNKTQNVTAVTDWNIATYTFATETDIIKFYGNIIGFRCSNNEDKISGADISNNLALREFNCDNNEIATLDVSKNTALEVLSCKNNLLKSIDVSKNLDLQKLHCDGNMINELDVRINLNLTSLTINSNRIATLDVSNNSKLNNLECYSNEISTLDFSKNANIRTVICFDNPLTTSAMNEAYCSLPAVKEKAGLFFPLNTKNDANHTVISSATANIAVNKNWEVKYYNNGSLPYNDVQSNGNYNCDTKQQEANLNRFIKLTVKKGEKIRLDLKAVDYNTPVIVESGSEKSTIAINSAWLSSEYMVPANDNIITIYGDITGFSCSQNNDNVTAIDTRNNPIISELFCNNNMIDTLDLSLNTELKNLNCANNQVKSLDLRYNTKLELLSCYNNPLTTQATNIIYCSLPIVNGTTGKCYTLNNESDEYYKLIAEATSDNARAKNWTVLFKESETDIPNTGNFDCNSGVDASQFSGISVFPNPAYGKVQVLLKEEVNETLILVDLNGRALLTADVLSGKANIDVSNLTAGTYFIRVGNRVQKLTVK